MTFTRVGAALFLSLMLVASFRQPTFAESDEKLNVALLQFTNAQINPTEGSNQVVRAFVPTGSKSPKCFVSLNEMNNTSFPVATFCAEREPAGFDGVPGILISVFFPQTVIPNFYLSVNLYQEGAESYGAPVLCNASKGC